MAGGPAPPWGSRASGFPVAAWAHPPGVRTPIPEICPSALRRRRWWTGSAGVRVVGQQDRLEGDGLGDGFIGYSGRVGMAQDLAATSVELPTLMTAGRWKSSRMPTH